MKRGKSKLHLFILLTTLLLLSAGTFLILGVLCNEPAYQNKTAKQWFKERVDARRRGGTGQHFWYKEALIGLNTNFFPVYAELWNHRSAFSEEFYKPVFESLPGPLQECLPLPLPIPWSWSQTVQDFCFFRTTAHSNALFQFLQHEIRSSIPNTQHIPLSLAAILAFGHSTNEPYGYLSHPEFAVRFWIALNGKRAASNELQLSLATLVEATTNSILMSNTFGHTANGWKRTAMQKINELSPSTTINYNE